LSKPVVVKLVWISLIVAIDVKTSDYCCFSLSFQLGKDNRILLDFTSFQKDHQTVYSAQCVKKGLTIDFLMVRWGEGRKKRKDSLINLNTYSIVGLVNKVYRIFPFT